MNLKELTDLLIQLPTLPTVALVAEQAGVSIPTVMAAARDGESLGYIAVCLMPEFGRVLSLTPLGAERADVVLVDVAIRSGDDWREEPRWMPSSYAWWLLQDARGLGYPVLTEEEDEDSPDPRERVSQEPEPLEYLIVNEQAEMRRAVDGSILPYPIHFYGLGAPWPLATVESAVPRHGLASDGTSGPCPVCHRSMPDPVGYCGHCDTYGLEARLPKVTRRPSAHRAQLNPRCSLAGGRGPSKAAQRFRNRNKGKNRRAG